MAAFPPLARLVTWASAYIRPAQPPIPGVIPSTLAADLAAVVARCERVEALETALRTYGDHLESCDIYPVPDGCTCGLVALLAHAKES